MVRNKYIGWVVAAIIDLSLNSISKPLFSPDLYNVSDTSIALAGRYTRVVIIGVFQCILKYMQSSGTNLIPYSFISVERQFQPNY